jgi:SAM-dependent methyltransferase
MAEGAPQDKPDQAAAHRVFDRQLVAARRARALPGFSDHDFLHTHVAEELSDRLMAVQRTFNLAVEIGARSGAFAKTEATRPIKRLYGMDLVTPRAHTAHAGFVVADEERLPLAEEALDLVVAPLCLHAVNDLPGVLTQIRRALKPDGLFLGTLFGGETLTELRQALMEAEVETTGGASPRVAPVVDIRDAGHLLQRAGLALPVADSDILTIRYDSAVHLMADLAGMGEANALADRHRRFTRRATITRAAEIYQNRFADPDGRVRASFEILYLSGWAPHESQQKPLRPGSAKARLADALGAKEMPAGDKPRGH